MDNVSKRKIIMKNYAHPSQFVKSTPPDFYLKIHGKIDTCSDEFDIFVSVEQDIIKNILFNGEGCSISTASLNLLATYLIGKTIKEALLFIHNYILFVNGQKSDKSLLHKLLVFENVHSHLNRKECALLGANHLQKLLVSI